MISEVKPEDTSRADAFELWMTSPMPMVTLTKTIDVTRLVRLSSRHNLKFNMLLCWCVGRAASGIDEFYSLPFKDKFVKYDSLSVNVIVPNAKGGINSCDVPLTDSIHKFNEDYLRLTDSVSKKCESVFLDDTMVIGTSAMIQTELDGIVNQYTDLFSNPMVLWGKYRSRWFGYILPVSFQFHHVQMDGSHGAMFLERLQKETANLKI